MTKRAAKLWTARATLSTALFCVVALVGCGTHGSSARAKTTVAVVGQTSTTTGAVTSTTITTVPSVPTAPVAANYGEGPIPEAPALPAPTTVPVALSDPISQAAHTFFVLYWSPGTLTFGQLADAETPVATPEFLAQWRDPTYASSKALPGAPVDLVSLTVTATTPGGATVVAKGVNTSSGDVIWRTANFVQGADGAWRISGFQ